MRRTLSALLVLAALASARADAAPDDPAAAPPLLPNASFETPGPGAPGGWDVFEGQRDDGAEQKSEIALDRDIVRDGKTSLRLSGSAGTTSWQFVRRRVAVTPGQRITLRVAAKNVNVRKEGRQLPNANALLEFVDAKGARVQVLWGESMTGTRDWRDVRITGFVPAAATGVWVGFFLSQSGTVWFDDVRLALAPGTAADPAGRAAAFDAIETHLLATYPFFGLGKRPRADGLFTKWRGVCLAAPDDESFVRGLRTMLADLDDLHVWLRRGTKVTATATAAVVRSNFDAAARRAALTDVLDEQPPLVAGRIGAGPDAVGYLAIATWSMDEATSARLEADFAALADCRALVLDVRMNVGGDEAVAERVASRFAAADVVYAATRVSDPASSSDDAILPAAPRTLAPRKGTAPDARPVAVLQGRTCMSTCETFLLMARALPTVTTVGDRSRGACGVPRSLTVLPDLTLWSSTTRVFPPASSDATAPETGTDVPPTETIEGRGVAPEVEVLATPTRAADPVLAKALEILRR